MPSLLPFFPFFSWVKNSHDTGPCAAQTKQQMSSSEFLNRAADIVAKEKRELVAQLRSRVTELADSLLALEMFQIEQYEVIPADSPDEAPCGSLSAAESTGLDRAVRGEVRLHKERHPGHLPALVSAPIPPAAHNS